MEIIEVNTKKQLKEFIEFPDRLYKDCPQYVPALHMDQVHSLTSCASLKYCTHKLWLAKDDGGVTVGRISAMVNPRYNELYGRKCCRFGWFDTIEDFSVAKALMDTATAWAAEQGMTQIHGPLYYNTLGKQGLLIDGFENIPQFNNLYNFPYYVDFIERLGFEKECDWVQYLMNSWELPERLSNIADRLQERYQLHFEPVEKLKKDKGRVMQFLKLYSDTFARSVYNFIPFTQEEMEEEAGTSMAMLSNNYCSILVDKDNEIAGFGINFPSISKALQKARGHLFPFGWFHILRAVYGPNDTADLMINGTTNKWQGKGLSAVYHKGLSRSFSKTQVCRFITNPQIETNNAVNVWADYNGKLYMRRRCYIKDIR